MTSSSGELSLFNNERYTEPESEPKNKKDLEKDLVEVKSFLINLLNEIG